MGLFDALVYLTGRVANYLVLIFALLDMGFVFFAHDRGVVANTASFISGLCLFYLFVENELLYIKSKEAAKLLKDVQGEENE